MFLEGLVFAYWILSSVCLFVFIHTQTRNRLDSSSIYMVTGSSILGPWRAANFTLKSQTPICPHYLYVDLYCESKLSHIWLRLFLWLLARVVCTETGALDYRAKHVQSVFPHTVQT